MKKTIGVRHIKYNFINRIIEKTGPLAATSINISGEKSTVKFRKVPEKIIKKVDVGVVYDTMIGGKGSKVINLISGETLRK